MKKIITILLLISILLTVGCSSAYFDFTTENLTKYYRVSLSDITGGTYEIDLPDEVTEEDVWKEFRRLRLYHATYGSNDLDTYASLPGYGDDVRLYYDIKLEQEGESIASNLYSKSAQSVVIGQWEFPDTLGDAYSPVFDNATFSDFLMSTQPSERVREGVVQAGDVVFVDYRASLVSDNSLVSTESAVRIDTGVVPSTYADTYGEEFARQAVGKTVGTDYSFTVTQMVGEAECEVIYHYRVAYIAKETFRTVAIEIPEGAYDEQYSAAMQSLNGKTAYVSFAISRFIDYDTPDLDVDFFVNKLELKTEETDPELVLQEAFAKMLEQMKQTRLVEKVYPQVWATIFDRLLLEEDRVLKLPKKTVELEYDLLVEKGRKAYASAKTEAETNGTTFSYSNIDDFASDYFGYDSALYSTMIAFLRAEAEYQTTLKLITFAIAQVANIRTSATEYEPLVEEYLAYLISHYETNLQSTVTPEQIYANYGAGTREDFAAYVHYMDTEGKILEYLYKNNTWNDRES